MPHPQPASSALRLIAAGSCKPLVGDGAVKDGSAAGVLAWCLPAEHPAPSGALEVRGTRTHAALANGAGIAAASLLARQSGWITAALAAAAILGGGYLMLALLTPSQVGMGDVRLTAILSALLGVHGWTTMLLGAVLPYLVALPFTIGQLRRPTSARRSAGSTTIDSRSVAVLMRPAVDQGHEVRLPYQGYRCITKCRRGMLPYVRDGEERAQ